MKIYLYVLLKIFMHLSIMNVNVVSLSINERRFLTLKPPLTRQLEWKLRQINFFDIEYMSNIKVTVDIGEYYAWFHLIGLADR